MTLSNVNCWELDWESRLVCFGLFPSFFYCLFQMSCITIAVMVCITSLMSTCIPFSFCYDMVMININTVYMKFYMKTHYCFKEA
jgi:hypothetical protein